MNQTTQQRQDLARAFDRDGFVVIPNLITCDEAHALKAEVLRLVDDQVAQARRRGEKQPAFMRTGVFVGLSIHSNTFRCFARDPRLVDTMEALIGPNVMFWSDKVVFKTDEADFGTPWHQDWPYWKGLHKITLWIALDDIDASNGCLQLVRGSHRVAYDHHGGRGPGGSFGHQLDAASVDAERIVTVPAPSGTAVAFHDLTAHASHPNTSRRDRYAVALTYKDAAADDLDYPTMTAAIVVRGRGRE